MRSRPLTLAATGLLLVAVDGRVVALDVLPDVGGWLLVAVASWRLGAVWPARLAAVAGLASTAELLLPYHHEALDSSTGMVVAEPAPGTVYAERIAFDDLAGARFGLIVGAVVVGSLAVALLLRFLRARARLVDDGDAAGRLAVLAVAVPAVWAAPFVGAALWAGSGRFDPVWNGSAELPALAGLAVLLTAAYVLVSGTSRRWGDSGQELDSPWADLMTKDLGP